MAGDEPSKSKSQTSSRVNSPIPPITLTLPQDPPENSTAMDRRETRASSPSGIPSEIHSRAETQLTRFESLTALKNRLPTCAPNITLEELKVYSSHLEDLNKAFQKEHAYFDVAWPRTHRDHVYYNNKLLFRETELCFDIRLQISRLKQELAPFEPQCTPASAKSATSPGKLPELAIPTFTGEYIKWPAYSELFTALIGSSKALTDIEKLQYLRISLSGEPAQKVEALPLKGASFQPAWELLKEAYSNKRLLIQTQLDKLFSTKPVVNKNAAARKQLITTVDAAQTSLNSLGITHTLGDCILAHHVIRQLDKSTREAWETSLGSKKEYPTFNQVREFVTNKVTALERSETPSSQCASSSGSTKVSTKLTAQRASSNQASTSSATPKSFICDCCGADHFNSLAHSTTQLAPAHSSQPHSFSSQLTLLATAQAQLISPASTHQVRMLFDSGSELTFVKEELLTQLNLKRTHSSISIIGIGGKKSTQTRGVVSLTLRSIYRPVTISLQAHVLRSVTSRSPSVEVPNHQWPHLAALKLADPDFLKPRSVDIVIGADTYGQVIKPNIIRGSPSMPIAQLSIFGWLVLGPIASSATFTQSSYHTSLLEEGEPSVRDLLEKFWIQEELPSDTPSQLNPEEQECEDHFRTTHTRDATGRYIVRIPLKSPSSLLGNSYQAAHACLKRTLTKLTRSDEYRELYQAFLSEYEHLNHMVRAPSISSSNNSIFYLPHHGILKPDNKTTKLRVVFNGSCTTTSGYSLNDLMHTGHNLLLNISDVLLWIRQHRYIFATDITKMYRQIRVHEDDQDLQRILWVDEEGKEIAFKLTTVTYGTKAASFLAVRALLQLTEDEGHRFPLAVPSITHARYVDDIFGGADTGEQLIKIAQHLKDLCHAGGFPLAKWHSTHPALLEAISPNSRAENSTISLDDCHNKILGLQWNSFQDNFTFLSKSNSTTVPTKRLILSDVSQIFDPLSFLSPVIIRAKMILQELWLHKLSWDDPLPPQVISH